VPFSFNMLLESRLLCAQHTMRLLPSVALAWQTLGRNGMQIVTTSMPWEWLHLFAMHASIQVMSVFGAMMLVKMKVARTNSSLISSMTVL
jgi:hypothetical protein